MIKIYSKNISGTWFGVGLQDDKILGSAFDVSQNKVLSNLQKKLKSNAESQVYSQPSDFANQLFDFLSELFLGTSSPSSVDMEMRHLPIYTQRVLKAVACIPVGYVASYGAVAELVGGNPRAVGNVMANNPFVPIVPCHRVVKSDFSLGGYGGGLKIKLDYLLREKQGFQEAKNIEFEGKQLLVYPVERVLSACYLF
jgi:O-6-methylguanine DNA methyltransferase